MSLIVITREADGDEQRSSPMFCVEQALTLACRMIKDGVTVVRIEGFGQEIDSEEIAAWCREQPPTR